MTPNADPHHEVFSRFDLYSGEAHRGFEVDFLGCRTRHEFRSGCVPSGIPQQNYPQFDEEYFEWIDLLESVVQARETYTMIELGAGYGRWMVRAAAAMQQYAGLPCLFVGVEAEPFHFKWIPMHFQDNGIDPGAHRFLHAAVTARAGHSHFYVGSPVTAENSAVKWYGQRLIKAHEIPAKKQGGEYLGFPLVTHQSGYKTIRVRTVSLSELLRGLSKVDFLDLDVQGEEFKVLSASIADATKKVKRIHIGTHSTEIEAGLLRQLFAAAGWQCLADYTCYSTNSTPWGPIPFEDGVQTWLNPEIP